MRHKKLTIVEHLGGSQEVLCDNVPLLFTVIDIKPAVRMTDVKELNAIMDQVVLEERVRVPHWVNNPCPDKTLKIWKGCELVDNSIYQPLESGLF